MAQAGRAGEARRTPAGYFADPDGLKFELAHIPPGAIA